MSINIIIILDTPIMVDCVVQLGFGLSETGGGSSHLTSEPELRPLLIDTLSDKPFCSSSI